MGSGMEGGCSEAALWRLVFAMGWGIAVSAGVMAAEFIAESCAESGAGAATLRALE
jgi:uncharacterized membrane protein YraQ (UPF0718 family)